MMPQIVVNKQVRVPLNLFKDLKGAAKQKKVEKHCTRAYKIQLKWSLVVWFSSDNEDWEPF